MLFNDRNESFEDIRTVAKYLNLYADLYILPPQDQVNHIIALIENIISSNFGYEDNTYDTFTDDMSDMYCARRRSYEQLRDGMDALKFSVGNVSSIVGASCEIEAAYVNFGMAFNLPVSILDVRG